MGHLSIWHWEFLPIVWIVWIVPLYRLLGRVGFARGWAFVALFPPAGMVLLWTIAFIRWRVADVDDGPAMGSR